LDVIRAKFSDELFLLLGHELKICIAAGGLVEHLHMIEEDRLPVNSVGLKQIDLSLLETLASQTQIEHFILQIIFE